MICNRSVEELASLEASRYIYSWHSSFNIMIGQELRKVPYPQKYVCHTLGESSIGWTDHQRLVCMRVLTP